MNESQLLALFQQALRASLALPVAASAAACGSAGAVAHDAAHGDGGPVGSGSHARDAGKADVASATSESTHSSSSGTMDAGPVESGEADAKDSGAGDAPSDCSIAPAPCELSNGNGITSTPIPFSCVAPRTTGDASPLNSPCNLFCEARYPWRSCISLDGATYFACYTNCGNGRAYDGMAAPSARGQRSTLGKYLAESAQLEAASVDAFRILRNELEAHGAPRGLIEAADAAARDEARHARTTRSLARRHGPCPPHRRATKRDVRALEAIAAENAVEGCVRETYGALVAHHQALAAADPQIRKAMATIARDETRHAAWGWELAGWADARLDDAGRARVRVARGAAVRDLGRAVRREIPVSLVVDAGLPDPDSAARMLEVLRKKLWS